MRNQNTFVLRHLVTHGYITDLVARNYGIRRLAARIHELRNGGMKIERELRRDDQGYRYAYYTMPAQQRTICRRAIRYVDLPNAA